MNTYDADYKDYLQVGKLTNSLTAEEEKKFELLLQTDPFFQQAFLAMSEKLSPDKLHALSKFKDNSEWDDVTQQFIKRSLVDRYGITRIVASVIIVIGLAVGIIAVWGPERKQSGKTEIATLQKPSIKIQLANGEVIDLSEMKGPIKTTSATINNSGENLTYSLTDSVNGKMNTLMVSSGKEYQITLSDGTRIWLNSATRLDFPFSFSKDKREISIDGEAYLEVAKNADKPFIVHLKKGDIEVLGTEFNINSYDHNAIKVSLVNGAVNFNIFKESIKLSPGHQVNYTNEKLTRQPFNASRVLSWRKGLLYFDQTPINQISKDIERLFNVKVVIDNTRNDNKRYVGVLNRNEPLKDFLEALDFVSDIDSYFDKDGVLHFK